MEKRSGRSQDIKVGVFLLAALSILIVGSLWIAGSSSLSGVRVSYQVLLKDSRGVEAGDRVRLAGVAVGRIQSVTLNSEDEWPVQLEIGVRSDIAVRENGSTVMATNGLLGSSFLQLVPGTPDSPLLPPGGTIYGGAAGGMEGAMARVEDLADTVVGVLEQTSGLLDQVSNELGPIMTGLQDLLSERNIGEIHAVLASLHATLDEVSPRLGDDRQGTRQGLTETHRRPPLDAPEEGSRAPLPYRSPPDRRHDRPRARSHLRRLRPPQAPRPPESDAEVNRLSFR